MVLRVYDEGKVKKKLKKLLDDNQLNIQEGEGYSLYSFKVSDECLYAEMVKQYGRSVIIEEPKELKESMIAEIKEAFTIYEQI